MPTRKNFKLITNLIGLFVEMFVTSTESGVRIKDTNIHASSIHTHINYQFNNVFESILLITHLHIKMKRRANDFYLPVYVAYCQRRYLLETAVELKMTLIYQMCSEVIILFIAIVAHTRSYTDVNAIKKYEKGHEIYSDGTHSKCICKVGNEEKPMAPAASLI